MRPADHRPPAESRRVPSIQTSDRPQVRHADQLPAGNWPALWEALGTAAYEPRLVWEPSELAALHDEQRFIYLAGLSKT